MVTVSYGLHRKKSEILVAKMMGELAKQPYENIDFLNLKGKYWGYLAKRTQGFIFDVHGGELKIQLLDVEIPMPRPNFILYSSTTEEKYLEFLYSYKYGLASIILVHKNEMHCCYRPPFGSIDLLWGRAKTPVSFNDMCNGMLEYARKYGLENRLVGVELLNASKEEQLEQFHKPFMESFLQDLDSIS